MIDCFFFHYEILLLIDIDFDEIFHRRSSIIHEGIFRIQPRFSSESFDVKCIFENNIGEIERNKI